MLPQPLEGLLVADVHAQRHLRLAAVATEVALADEEAEQESDRQIVLLRRQLLVGGGCVGRS